jgi:hypothetical protein
LVSRSLSVEIYSQLRVEQSPGGQQFNELLESLRKNHSLMVFLQEPPEVLC